MISTTGLHRSDLILEACNKTHTRQCILLSARTEPELKCKWILPHIGCWFNLKLWILNNFLVRFIYSVCKCMRCRFQDILHTFDVFGCDGSGDVGVMKCTGRQGRRGIESIDGLWFIVGCKSEQVIPPRISCSCTRSSLSHSLIGVAYRNLFAEKFVATFYVRSKSARATVHTFSLNAKAIWLWLTWTSNHKYPNKTKTQRCNWLKLLCENQVLMRCS